MSISSELIILNQTKQNINSAINLKGVSVTDEAFAEYPNKVMLIPNGSGTYESQVILFLEGKLKHAVIPDGTTSVGDYAFSDMTIESVTIPNTVVSIGNHSFTRCYSLTSLTIPDSVTYIGNYSFYVCNGLASLNMGSYLQTIGDNAFYACSSLTSIEIPNTVSSIGEEAFYRCNGLLSVTCLSVNPPTLGADAFRDTNNCPIYVPSESVLAYQTSDGWINYASRITAIS